MFYKVSTILFSLCLNKQANFSETFLDFESPKISSFFYTSRILLKNLLIKVTA